MIFAFMAYKGNFSDKASSLVEQFIAFRMLGLHLERLSDIALIDKESPHVSLAPPYENLQIKGALQLDNICYRYNSHSPYILKSLNVAISQGECVAIIGPSGCGKTTLLKILTGLLSPETGQIKIDGKKLADMALENYRRQIGVVMQEDSLFAGSIAENIAFFDPQINMQAVWQASQLASMHDDIMAMPMKYETLVGDMGAALSGGQKQRILLARALYKQPKVLLMDEGTAHLDIATEQKVNQSLISLGITRIIIAHRPQTIMIANRVLEFVGGQLQEVWLENNSRPINAIEEEAYVAS